jgi:hypothetical protein
MSGSGSTAVVDRFERQDPVARPVETDRGRRLRERSERRQAREANTAAAEALRRAMAWAAEMEATGIRRADIARRERLTRARVTQVMSLLELPDVVKAAVLAGGEPRTIRGALEAGALTA